MLDQVLDCFELQPDYDLNLMTPGQTLAQTTSRVLAALDPILAAEKFDMAVVQGDTTTTMAGAMAAFYRGIPVAHVEAGLRTGDMTQPFPGGDESRGDRTPCRAALRSHRRFAAESAGRRRARPIASSLPEIRASTRCFTSPTRWNGARSRFRRWEWLDSTKKLIVVTAHRRESFGDGIDRICEALGDAGAARRRADCLPRASQSQRARAGHARLGALPNVLLIEPLDYPRFVDLMRRAYLLITDSGGIQEEAPSLGKPVLVMRDCTERPEAVAAGTVKLVAPTRPKIVCEATRLLEDSAEYARMSHIHNPYGDGQASQRIVEMMASFLH